MVVDRRSLPLRLVVFRVLVTAIFLALAVCFWYLQVLKHATYREMAENNHQRTLALRAPRGMLFDRDGRPLVRNRYAFNISLVREQSRDVGQALSRLSRLLGVEEPALRDIVARYRREPSYRPIVLVQDASPAQLAAVTARRLSCPR